MSLSVLALGTLSSDPQERTSASNKSYCTALLRVPVDGEESVLASLIAFDATAVQALLRLHKGDPISVAGMGKLTSWTGKDGVEKRGISVTVQAVLSIYQARKARKAVGEGDESAEHSARRSGAPTQTQAYDRSQPIETMADDIPF